MSDRPPWGMRTRPTVRGTTPPVALVTGNSGPSRPFRFGAFIATPFGRRLVRTEARSAGQNVVGEGAFGALKFERLYRAHIADPLDVV